MSTEPREQTVDFAGRDGFEPGWFGDPERPLLGWYLPPRHHARGCGVVLCPPFGHEYLVCYRSYRHLAGHLANAGFAVFCFDYDATGDSAGEGGDPGRVAAWQRSIVAAMAQLRVCSGVAEVALFGVRLGGLLAASVAVTEPCAALMLLAPVASGRAYARELSAWRGMNPLTPAQDPTRVVGADEVVGYPFSDETRADLGRMDLSTIAELCCRRALVIARDQLAGGERRLAAAWTTLGLDVDLSLTDGYAAMMRDDAYDAVSPEAIWAEVTSWLSQRFPVQPAVAATPLNWSRSAVMQEGSATLREEVVTFGPLAGILTEPAQPSAGSLPAVILTNVGANHRVANHRLYVTLARDLAAKGFTVLRFDRAGMGDSQVAPGGKENDVYASVGIDNVRAAMDFLGRVRGHQRFVLGGLCSGAYFSFHAAAIDPRAVGLVMINILTFKWKEGDSLEVARRQSIKATGFYLRSSLSSSTWRRALTGDVNVALILLKLSGRIVRRSGTIARGWLARLLRLDPPLSKAAMQFRSMLGRGTEIMMIFGSDDAGIDLMHQHLGRDGYLIGHSSLFRLAIVDGVDHTFTPRWSQRYLRDMVSAHLIDRFK